MIKRFTNPHQFTSNTFVFSLDGSVLLVDPSYINKEIIEYIKSQGKVVGIILTHGHADHFYALNEYLNEFKGVDVYLHPNDYQIASNPHYNYSIEVYNQKIEIPLNAKDLNEGYFEIKPFKGEVILSKGHTSGSILIYFKEQNVLFTGDTIIGYSIGRTDLHGGSSKEMKESLTNFKNLNLPSETRICSGHEIDSTYGAQLKKNPYLK